MIVTPIVPFESVSLLHNSELQAQIAGKSSGRDDHVL